MAITVDILSEKSLSLPYPSLIINEISRRDISIRFYTFFLKKVSLYLIFV